MSANQSSNDAIGSVSRPLITPDGRRDFFGVPYEIRQHIYRDLLINTEGEGKVCLPTWSECPSGNIAPQILRTCKQIYNEAITVLYESNEFCTQDPLAFHLRHGRRMRHHNTMRIRKFCFDLSPEGLRSNIRVNLTFLSAILHYMSSLQSFTINTRCSHDRNKVLEYIIGLSSEPHVQAQALLESLGDGGGERSMRVVLRGAVQVGSEV